MRCPVCLQHNCRYEWCWFLFSSNVNGRVPAPRRFRDWPSAVVAVAPRSGLGGIGIPSSFVVKSQPARVSLLLLLSNGGGVSEHAPLPSYQSGRSAAVGCPAPHVWNWKPRIGAPLRVQSREPVTCHTTCGECRGRNHACVPGWTYVRQMLAQTYAVWPAFGLRHGCLLYTSPSPRDATLSRMPSSA